MQNQSCLRQSPCLVPFYNQNSNCSWYLTLATHPGSHLFQHWGLCCLANANRTLQVHIYTARMCPSDTAQCLLTSMNSLVLTKPCRLELSFSFFSNEDIGSVTCHRQLTLPTPVLNPKPPTNNPLCAVVLCLEYLPHSDQSCYLEASSNHRL